MAKCEWCGKKFDPEVAEDEFEFETYFYRYENIRPCLCGECAIKAIENKDSEVYYETCDSCGKEFDVFEDELRFNNHFPNDCMDDYRDIWDKLTYCADCAIEKAENDSSIYSSDYDDDDEVDEGCIACGNPAYPDCKSGCPAFDD